MNYQAVTLLLFIFFTIAVSCKDKVVATVPTTDSTQSVLHRTAAEGTKWNVLGSKITGKILSDDTNGEYAVIITETPPNGGPPKHIHTHEDELFYVLQGQYEFSCGEELIIAEKGDMVHLPKGKPHSFKNIDTLTGITMNTITPGGFEGFFAGISSLSERGLLGREQIDSLANIYEIRFIKSTGND